MAPFQFLTLCDSRSSSRPGITEPSTIAQFVLCTCSDSLFDDPTRLHTHKCVRLKTAVLIMLLVVQHKLKEFNYTTIDAVQQQRDGTGLIFNQ